MFFGDIPDSSQVNCFPLEWNILTDWGAALSSFQVWNLTKAPDNNLHRHHHHWLQCQKNMKHFHQYLSESNNSDLGSCLVLVLHIPLHQFLFLSVELSCRLEVLTLIFIIFTLYSNNNERADVRLLLTKLAFLLIAPQLLLFLLHVEKLWVLLVQTGAPLMRNLFFNYRHMRKHWNHEHYELYA